MSSILVVHPFYYTHGKRNEMRFGFPNWVWDILKKKKLKGFGMNLLCKIFTECSLIN